MKSKLYEGTSSHYATDDEKQVILLFRGVTNLILTSRAAKLSELQLTGGHLSSNLSLRQTQSITLTLEPYHVCTTGTTLCHVLGLISGVNMRM